MPSLVQRWPPGNGGVHWITPFEGDSLFPGTDVFLTSLHLQHTVP